MQRSVRVEKLSRRLVGDVQNDWQTYHACIESLLHGDEQILDVGCGRGRIAPFPWERHPGLAVTGLDPDPTAAQNPFLHHFVLLEDDTWAVPDAHFDLVLARYVLEHVDDAETFTANVARVLKPGGRFVFLTPNFHHPAMWVSHLLSHAAKRRILNRTQGCDESDVFGTHYRMNTRKAVSALANRHGLGVERLEIREYQPIGYLGFSVPTFLLAYAYYEAVRRTGIEERIGASILGCLRKLA